MSSFEFPKIHNFPPLYTLQPNLDTRRQQVVTWCDLICEYTQAKKQYALEINADTLKSPLFTNQSIERSIDLPFLKLICQEIIKRGQGEWKKGSKESVLLLYWKTPQDWANQIYQYVANTGQLDSVLTVFELLNGDDTIAEPFHGMDEGLFKKAIDILVKSGKAATFVGSSTDSTGIKFFG